VRFSVQQSSHHDGRSALQHPDLPLPPVAASKQTSPPRFAWAEIGLSGAAAPAILDAILDGSADAAHGPKRSPRRIHNLLVRLFMQARPERTHGNERITV